MSGAGHGGGHGARRRPRGGHEEEHENTERWLLSYSDMITVLMALFIVLFAISQVDQSKYDALRTSLAAGFGHPVVSVISGGQGARSGGERGPQGVVLRLVLLADREEHDEQGHQD